MKNFILFTILLIIPAAISGQETAYPANSNFQYEYALNNTQYNVGDTITIIRKLINNSTDSLTSLYFSDCLPMEFDISSQVVTINGVSRNFLYQSFVAETICENTITYHWILSSPVVSDNISQPVQPNDTVTLIITLTCQSTGTFPLPFHTAVGYTASGGIFSMADSANISVVISTAVEDDIESTLIPDKFTISVYPNPFNSSISFSISGLDNKEPVKLKIFDILGRLVHQSEHALIENNQISWDAAGNIGSGVYFYRINNGDKNSLGKIVLLK